MEHIVKFGTRFINQNFAWSTFICVSVPIQKSNISYYNRINKCKILIYIT
jgi:hypothetical protein